MLDLRFHEKHEVIGRNLGKAAAAYVRKNVFNSLPAEMGIDSFNHAFVLVPNSKHRAIMYAASQESIERSGWLHSIAYLSHK